jgi:hypothetical protein
MENPWKHRSDAPIGIVVDDQNFDDTSTMYLSVTGPAGSFEVHQPLALKAAALPNGAYTIVGHWRVPCIGDGTGNSVAAQSDPFTWQLAVPPLRPTPGIFVDPLHGRKSFQGASVDAAQYCGDEANMYKDEPFSLTVYYTTTGAAPTPSSPHFVDENAHGCSVEPGSYRRKPHRMVRGRVSIGGDRTGHLDIAVRPPGNARALIVARSGGAVVSAIRVRFIASVGPKPAPGKGTQGYEQVKLDRGGCPVTCSTFHRSPGG